LFSLLVPCLVLLYLVVPYSAFFLYIAINPVSGDEAEAP